ncbi:MAG: murein DD-endopeptidase [Chthoniobacter sp.]|nr:murein DD-endopeptidase [Chthoniobacter sp.]
MKSPFFFRAARLGALLLFATHSIAAALDLTFPTQNRALLQGDGEGFYMFIDRDLQGEKSTPWEGGQYGYVRDPRFTSGGLVYTRFHEGVDIKPLQRSGTGEPLDMVTAAAAGRVVHASNVPGYSNYGRFVVIEHQWDGCPYYSLYAHLNSLSVSVGQRVAQGDALGRLGYTGDGIDRRRAHVHFEVNLILSHDFERWHKLVFPSEINRHGIYNGINLAGMDAGRLLLAAHKSPGLTIPAFLASEEVAFKAVVPATNKFVLAKLYPWMIRGDAKGAKAWEISFTSSGLPLRLEPRREAVSQSAITSATPSKFPLTYVTKGYVSGTSKSPTLTPSGRHFLRLVSGDFQGTVKEVGAWVDGVAPRTMP